MLSVAVPTQRTVPWGATLASVGKTGPKRPRAITKLTGEQKAFVVVALARFETPTDVQKAVLEAFGVDVSTQLLSRYDPSTISGGTLSAELRKLFADTRAAFIRDLDSTPGSHQVVRMRELWKLYLRDSARGATVLARQHLEQMAKERGAFYDRRSIPDDPDLLAMEFAKLLNITSEEAKAYLDLTTQ